MMKTMKILMLVISTLLIFIACSPSTPQDQMKEIDKLMSEEFPTTVEEKEKVALFTAAGKSLLEEGKTEDASEAFDNAIKTLTMAQDAYIFNKAD